MPTAVKYTSFSISTTLACNMRSGLCARRRTMGNRGGTGLCDDHCQQLHCQASQYFQVFKHPETLTSGYFAEDEVVQASIVAQEDPLKALFTRVVNEVGVTWRACHNDLTATLFPYTVVMISLASMNAPATIDQWMRVLGMGWLYIIPYLVQFNYASQAVSPEEDAMEKPYRPIPSGLITGEGAMNRFALWACVFMGVSWAQGVAHWCAAWLGITCWYCFWGGDSDWIKKNLGMITGGVVCMYFSAWESLYGPATAGALAYGIFVSIWSGAITCIQDYRDVAGDTIQGRQTLPVAHGDASRAPLAAVVTAMGAGIFSLPFVTGYMTPAALGVATVAFAWSALLSWRLVTKRTVEADISTYEGVCLLYTYMLATSHTWVNLFSALF